MVEMIIVKIQQDLIGTLNLEQLEALENVLIKHLSNIMTDENSESENHEKTLLPLFIAANA